MPEKKLCENQEFACFLLLGLSELFIAVKSSRWNRQIETDCAIMSRLTFDVTICNIIASRLRGDH